MKLARASACLLAATAASASDNEAAVTPMQKVVEMLGDMKSKVVADGKAEDAVFEEKVKLCSKGETDAKYEIKTGEATIEDLNAAIAKSDADITASSTRAGEITDAIAKNQADLSSATEVRKKEQADFTATITELKDSVDMLGRAIGVLKKKVSGTALLQTKDTDDESGFVGALSAVLDAAVMDTRSKTSLLSFVSSQSPDVAAYTKKSGSIIEVLQDMKSKARMDLNKIEMDASNSRNSFELLKGSLENQVSTDQKELEQVKADGAAAAEEKATAESDLAVTKKDLEADKQGLDKLGISCRQSAQDNAAAVKSRKEELEALEKASGVIAEKTGAASADQYGAASFIQIRNHISTPQQLHSLEVGEMVRALAREDTSGRLEQLAANIESLMQVSQPKDAFASVTKLLNDMIARLKNEAGAESTQKQYCDKETAKNEEKLAKLTSAKDFLQAKIDKKDSKATTLASEVAQLKKDLAELATLQAEMEADRQKEKKIFEETQKNLSDGLEGVNTALKILRDFYGSKNTDAATGVLSLLEVVQSDFSRAEVESQTEEDSAAENYKQVSLNNANTKLAKTADVQYKTKAAAALRKASQDLISDREANEAELEAVLQYKESLAQQCTESKESYGERVAKREEEIEGLKGALKAMGGPDLS
eukprot:TRINITY_DN22735_c4_g1_i1.p1 TRINITY_DN22735_c4_g1~~TRINITY_DN22735_c4_g1_i1.p1  ORF type:complete len:654 (-),score=238.17 TRINITY_DN22735_c4_g1_i1:329-2290(-)